MASNDQKTSTTVALKLTEEQKIELAKTFGQELVDRLEHIELDQIAGFLKADMVVN